MAHTYLLIADITGSTTLFDTTSTDVALARVRGVLDRMRAIIAQHGGNCVKSVGDDTLSLFPSAEAVFQAGRAMIETDWQDGLDVHIGASFGDVINQGGDLYGDAVITAARLSALAKPGEFLVDQPVFDALEAADRMLFVSMGGIKLKGKVDATRVHSFTVGDLDAQTVFKGAGSVVMGRRTESVVLRHQGASWSLTDGQSMTVGRAPGCEAVLQHPWVSRTHGRFELRDAQLEYTDHSSSGSTVITSGGRAFSLQRRAMLLNGEGKVLVGTTDPDLAASIIHYATNDLIPDGG